MCGRSTLLFFVFFVLIACQKNNHSPICDRSFTWGGSFVDSGCANGKIILKNFKGKIYMPSINRWGDSIIQGLHFGQYPVVLYSDGGCTSDTLITIVHQMPGPRFLTVMPVLKRYCSNCHSGNNPHAGIDLTDSCSVIVRKERIFQRAVLGVPSTMPSTGLIPLSDRQVIEQWVAAGGRWTD